MNAKKNEERDEFPLNGVYAAVLSPLRADLSYDFKTSAAHCKDLMERGCDGVVLFGTTGEGASFSVEKRKEALRGVIENGINPKNIILSAINTSVEDTASLALEGVLSKCSAVMILPPFYFKNVSEEGVIDFYRDVIQQVGNKDLRIILYHIPQVSGVPITLKIISTLRQEFPNQVIGLKESEGNLDFTMKVLKQFPGFKVFVGNESQISEAVRNGAAGAICGVANVYPEMIQSFYNEGLAPAGEKQQKQSNDQDKLTGLFDILKDYAFIPAMKNIIAASKDPHWNLVRPPLISLKNKESDDLLAKLKKNSLL